MAYLFLVATALVTVWLVHHNPQRRLLVGIVYGIIAIAFYDRLDILGAGVIYGSIALVMWFFLQ